MTGPQNLFKVFLSMATIVAVVTALPMLMIVCPSTVANAAQVDPVETEIASMVQKQSDAWNRGDIPEFMVPYWHDDRLTFSSGGATTRTWQATLDRYRKKYPDKATMGHLIFSELETQRLGPDAALTLGRWQLKRESPVGGNFSLVWKKIDGVWLIIHDHSSSVP